MTGAALPKLLIRPALAADGSALAALQNQIIAIGGSTAHQQPRDRAEVTASYITGADCLCCHLALAADGGLLGFQAVGAHPDLAADWGDIGSYVAPEHHGGGIGRALFAATRAACLAKGLRCLNATIRADNVAGLAYYTRIGFVPYQNDPDFTLQDGRRVGRIHHRLEL